MQETWVLISGLGRSAGEGNSSPPQYSGLESPMGCAVHGVTKSDTTEQASLSREVAKVSQLQHQSFQ